MRHLSKKAICAFASAVMLCGASAIPANAATKISKNISIGNSRYGTSTGRFEPSKVELQKFKDLVKQSESTISLNRSKVLLYEGETTTITFNVGSETDIAKGNGAIMYQWYNENGAIEGATASSYTTGALGTYYCEVWNTNISNLNLTVAETSLSAKKSTSFSADALRAENSVTLNDTADSAKAVHSDLSTFLRNIVVHPLALFPADHKSAVAEHLHMVRECRLTQVKLLKEMTGA